MSGLTGFLKVYRVFSQARLRLTIIGVAITCSHVLFAAHPSDDVLNFREWKAQKVYEAEQTMDRARRDLKGGKSTARNQPSSTAGDESGVEKAGRVQARNVPQAAESFADAQRTMKAARDLTATDYFLLYLRFLPADQIRRQSEKLSKKELAEILASIRNPPAEIADSNSQTL